MGPQVVPKFKGSRSLVPLMLAGLLLAHNIGDTAATGALSSYGVVLEPGIDCSSSQPISILAGVSQTQTLPKMCEAPPKSQPKQFRLTSTRASFPSGHATQQ
jgi:hypothetical protein